MDEQRNSRPAATVTAENAIRRNKIHIKLTTIMSILQVVIAICLIILTFVTVVGKATEPEPTFTAVEYQVKKGDTLWSIARQYKPEDMTMDAYMAWVYEHNESGIIFPGDVIVMAEVER